MKNFIVLLTLIILTSCFSRVEKTGYMFENIDFENIKKGVTSKSTIIKNCGNPTLISDINNQELWIYYSEDIKHFLFFKAKPVERKIIAISFNEEGRVNYIKNLDLSDESQEFSFNNNKTYVSDHNVNFIKAIYDNLGTIRPQ